LGTALPTLSSGLASNGEVEDYRIRFSSPTAVTLQSSFAIANSASALPLIAALVLVLVSTGVLLYRRQGVVR
jgi:hypothetical protein